MEYNHQIATNNFTIEPQDVVRDLFRATEEINFVHDRKLLEWKKMGLKGIRKHIVPDNHVDMFDEPNVEVLAKSLQYVLDNKNLTRV